MKAPTRVETERLVLVVPTAADAEAIFHRYASDPGVTKYLGWPTHGSIAQTRGFLEFSESEWTRWPAGPYLIRSRATGELLGGTGFTLESAAEAMTGYVLAQEAWGRGYATEALGAMVELSRSIDIARLFAFCHPDHRASARVLEKCGFARDAAADRPMLFPNLDGGVTVTAECYEIGLRRGA
jgi:ribosomal-protein-alanine N-acetyltransferase